MPIPRNSPCVCGSGLRYKNCCGKLGTAQTSPEAVGQAAGWLLEPEHRDLVASEPVCEFEGQQQPPGLLVRWLTDDYGWQKIAAGLAEAQLERAGEIYQSDRLQIDAEQRSTSIVDQGEWLSPIRELVRRAYLEEIEPFFDRRLKWFEAPQILRYRSGGFYRSHADCDEWDDKALEWKRVMDRHLSLLIYLDDNYAGGRLVLPNFNFILQPRAGMLVAFPSDYRYQHCVTPIASGTRHAVVSWSAVEGEKLLHPMPSYAVQR